MIKYLLNCALIFSIPFYCLSYDTTAIARIDSLLKKADSYQRAKPDSAIPLYKIVDSLSNLWIQEMDDKKIITQLTNQNAYAMVGAGSEYFNIGDYSKALNYFLLSYDLYQKTNNLDRLGKVHICLSRTYRCYGPEMFEKALSELKKSENIYVKLENKKALAITYLEIGWLHGDNICEETYNLDSALFYLEKAWKLSKETGSQAEIARINNGLSWMLSKLGRFDEALKKAKEVLNFYEETQSLTGLCDIHYTLGDLYLQMGDHKKSIFHLKKALELVKKSANTDMENNILELLSEVYLDLNDYKKAYEFYHLSVDKKFEMYSEEKINAIEEMKTKYETEKKELEIQSLNQQKNLQSKLIALLSLGILLTFTVIAVGWMFYKAKRKANHLLSTQNAEISQQKEEITTQRDEIEAQRDLVVQQKRQIELIHNELTSNIAYAQQIQNTLLPQPGQFSPYFDQHFIVFKPRDGVSGDFYWVHAFENHIAFCVADCTGHGVPGALMSMIGISFLNEIIQNGQDNNPSSILETLREKIIKALHQKGIRGEHKDGLDIAFCILHTQTLQLQYSGAMNPCWIIHQSNTPEFIELEPNLMPVAIHHDMASFSLQEIQLQKGDQVYLFTDGFADQNGGEKNKKIQSSRLKEILFENKHLDMQEQKNKIENYFDTWKGANPQIDDLTILGIKI